LNGWVAEAKVVVLWDLKWFLKNLLVTERFLECWLVAKVTAVVVVLLVLEFLSVGWWLR
jgi:hypothetical protein